MACREFNLPARALNNMHVANFAVRMNFLSRDVSMESSRIKSGPVRWSKAPAAPGTKFKEMASPPYAEDADGGGKQPGDGATGRDDGNGTAIV